MQWVEQLLSEHRGEDAWLFGKGPSLDQCDFSRVGPLRICVKESVLAVPVPRYFLSHNQLAITRATVSWPADCRAVLEPHFATYALGCGVPAEAVFAYYKQLRNTEVVRLPSRELAWRRSLFGNSGTAHSAIHFCKLVGVRRIVLVGFDGKGGYAKNMNIPAGGREHERIRSDLVQFLEMLGLSYTFA